MEDMEHSIITLCHPVYAAKSTIHYPARDVGLRQPLPAAAWLDVASMRNYWTGLAPLLLARVVVLTQHGS